MEGRLNPAEIQKQANEAAKTAEDAQKHSDFNRTIIIAIVIVLFIGFAGVFVAATSMLVDSYKSKAGSYEKLTEKINSQDRKMDDLNLEMQALQKLYESNQQNRIVQPTK